MRWKKNWYVLHRWLGLLVSLQLLAWSTGGFMFSILDIENVRGNADRTNTPAATIDPSAIRLSPAEALAVAGAGGVNVSELRLRSRFGRSVYEFFDIEDRPVGAVDAETGEWHSRITESQARQVALDDFAPSATVTSVTLIEENTPLEFRGGLLPVYQVILDHPKNPHYYVCPVTGEVLKRRNRPWRLFDFFWMLHIMDYGERENFNHWLLTSFSVLAILTSASGLVLWSWRVPKLIRRRKRELC